MGDLQDTAHSPAILTTFGRLLRFASSQISNIGYLAATTRRVTRSHRRLISLIVHDGTADISLAKRRRSHTDVLFRASMSKRR